MMMDSDYWFDFFLARELGMSVGEMQQRVTQREFKEWQAWYRLKWDRERRSKQ